MPAPAPKPQRLPRRGDLAEHPFPRLLLRLWRESFTGTLELSRERVTKRVTWGSGVPLFAESNRAGESLGRQLVDAERIAAEDLERISAHMERHDVREGAALLALGLLQPRDLFLALREQLRQRLVDCFGWPAGQFSLTETGTPKDDAQAFRVDPLQILQDGLVAHWSPDRMLAELAPNLERYPVPGPRFKALSVRLRQHPDVAELVATVDPARTFGEILYRAPSVERLAAAWVLTEAGALSFAEAACAEPGAESTLPPGSEASLDIELEVTRKPTAGAAAARQAAGDAAGPSAEAEALTKEVLDLHERLDELDHYEILGIAREDGDAKIKKAYFALAKRFHPDAVARAGLASLHREANELFARIAQAYQTLSDPARRHTYDRSGGDEKPAVDASRVAQAETLFRKGEVLIKVGNFAGALDFLRPCVELWPEEADYQGALGWALYKKKPSDPEGAREHLERAIELKPDDPVPLFRLGMVLRKLGEEEKGQELLDRSKALEKKPRR